LPGNALPVTTPDLVARIRALEAQARPLDANAEERARLRDPVLHYAETFLDGLPAAPAFVRNAGTGKPLLDRPIREEGYDLSELLPLLAEHVDRPGLNPASGGHLGYIPGGGLYAAALGDYLADVTNRYPGVTFASPGAARLEHMLVRWMADLAGYPASAGGTLLSGGSLANLTAIAAARDARGIRARDVERAVVYLSTQTHHSVAKALRVLGLGECVVRQVPLDDGWRMRADRLAAMAEDDRRQGLRPWLVVSSAGSTDTGAVDPLGAIADVAAEHGLWHHVDGAYGAFFLLTGHGRQVMRGIERSDSVVMDPHKTLFQPYGLGTVVVRERGALERAFRELGPYMQDAVAEADDEPWPADLSPELTRPFRGLRLWLPLMVYGLRPFRAALEEKLLLARYFHAEVGHIGFEAGPEPELSVVTYRFVPRAVRQGAAPEDRELVNRLNRRIMDDVVADGRVFISSTTLEGAFTLRFACVTHRTHLDLVDHLLGVLARSAAAREQELSLPLASRR
jgi:aromatic-L-amino-acid decarboxylase